MNTDRNLGRFPFVIITVLRRMILAKSTLMQDHDNIKISAKNLRRNVNCYFILICIHIIK